jgi:hypothetical protein
MQIFSFKVPKINFHTRFESSMQQDQIKRNLQDTSTAMKIIEKSADFEWLRQVVPFS